MYVDYIIVGQGICGTWMSYWLSQEKKTFLVIDKEFKDSPSRVAAGIINPVTGRRHVTVWMADKLLPFASKVYKQISKEIGADCILEQDLLDFFPTPQMRQSFMGRIEEGGEYLFAEKDDHRYDNLFNYEFGSGSIEPVYTVQMQILLSAWRKKLEKDKALHEEKFDIANLTLKDNGVEYKDWKAEKIIFCNGSEAANYPFFNKLPFAPNKGEILLAEIPGLPKEHIYKRGLMLIPLPGKDQWWIGSNYAWEFNNLLPTSEFRQNTEKILKEWIKLPFTITTHIASIRPATLERRPFVGVHPHLPYICILNGMGTKGCSLAPWFSKELAEHLVYQKPITSEADINRFSRILLRP